MTTDQAFQKLQDLASREVHFTWKHAFLIGAGLVSALIAMAAQDASQSADIAHHQRTLQERAPAVTELARVAEQVRNDASAAIEFRNDTRDRLRRIEDKLDKALAE